METSFTEIKRKETINLCDGKRLGKVCDIVFTYPEGKIVGFVVPGGRGFRLGKADLFIEMRNVTKIGVDVIFVDLRMAPKPKKEKEPKWGRDCPPPPPPSPQPREEPYPCRPAVDRRDYGEYE